MKFNGQDLINDSCSLFELRRGNRSPLTVRLQPLSLGFHQRLRTRGIVPPVPPVRIARDSSGKPLRDAQGMAITHPDKLDAEYLAATERYHQSVAVLSVVESLQGDAHISFESVPPADQTAAAWETYADQLFLEMEQAGFTAGDLILLCREVCRLSNLIDDHLVAARKNFSLQDHIPPG